MNRILLLLCVSLLAGCSTVAPVKSKRAPRTPNVSTVYAVRCPDCHVQFTACPKQVHLQGCNVPGDGSMVREYALTFKCGECGAAFCTVQEYRTHQPRAVPVGIDPNNAMKQKL